MIINDYLHTNDSYVRKKKSKIREVKKKNETRYDKS